jgi:hypothetical protein
MSVADDEWLSIMAVMRAVFPLSSARYYHVSHEKYEEARIQDAVDISASCRVEGTKGNVSVSIYPHSPFPS